MEETRLVVEELVFDLSGNADNEVLYFGYFRSTEEAVIWIRANVPTCDTTVENSEYTLEQKSSITKWTIWDAESNAFHSYCNLMYILNRTVFNEVNMLPTE